MQPRFNVMGSASLPVAASGEVGGHLREALAKAAKADAKVIAKAAASGLPKAPKSVGQLRRMLMKQHCVGRGSLDQEERFHVEIVVEVAVAALDSGSQKAAVAAAGGNGREASETTGAAAGGAGGAAATMTSYFVFWPMNWTVGHGLDDAAGRIKGWDAAGLEPWGGLEPCRAGSCSPLAALEPMRSAVLRDLGRLGHGAALEPFGVVHVRPRINARAGLQTGAARDSQEARPPQDPTTSEAAPATRADLLATPHESPGTDLDQRPNGTGDASSGGDGGRGSGSDVDMREPSSSPSPLSPPESVSVSPGAAETAEAAGVSLWTIKVKHGKEVRELIGLDPASSGGVGRLVAAAALAFVVPGRDPASSVKLLFKGALSDPSMALCATALKAGCTATMMVAPPK